MTPPATMPASVARTRQAICQRAGCTLVLDFADPCAACPAGHWGRYSARDCAAVGRAQAAPAPAPPQDWPALLRPLRLLARAEDRGLGDIVARVIGPFGGTAFEVWHRRLFGRPCGCRQRQEDWNTRYPLPPQL